MGSARHASATRSDRITGKGTLCRNRTIATSAITATSAVLNLNGCRDRFNGGGVTITAICGSANDVIIFIIIVIVIVVVVVVVVIVGGTVGRSRA